MSYSEQDIKEATVMAKADLSMFFGPIITDYELTYTDPQGNDFVSVDLLTKFHMIVVSFLSSGMDEVMRRIDFINKSVYLSQKKLILVAPVYDDIESINYMQSSLGVYLVRNMDEVSELIKKIG